MAAPTFDSVIRAANSASTAGANKAYIAAFYFWVKLGPTEGAKANGNGKNVLQFLKLAQKGAPLHAQQFNRSLNV